MNIRKPVLTLSKIATPNTGEYGTIVNYTVTVNNTSTTAHAYDIALRDVLPSTLTYITGSLISGVFSGTEINLFASGLSLDILPASSGASFTFQATPVSTVRPADVLTNQVGALYDTLPADISPYEWTGSVSTTADFTINDIQLAHTIASTTLTDTTSSLFSGALSDLAIGEGVTYRSDITIPLSTFTGFTITQTLPAGMKFLTGSILFDGVKSHTLSSIVVGPQNVITFSFGMVDNTGLGSGSGFTLLTDAVLLDHGANTAGTVKTSILQANYSAKTKSITRSVEVVEPVEPVLSVTKIYAPNTGDA